MTTHSNLDELLKKALRPGSSFYYSTLHLNQEDQKKLAVIFALFQKWLSLHNNNQEPQVAHTALHWWLEQVDQFSKNVTTDSQAQQSPHPLIQQLSFLHETPELKILVSTRMKLILVALLQNHHHHKHQDSLETFLRETWGNFCVICSFCIAEPCDDIIDIQCQAGILIGYHNNLKGLASQLGTQRCALPQSWFTEWDFTPTDLSAALQTHKENSTQINTHPKVLFLERIQQVLHQHQRNLEALLVKSPGKNHSCLPALKAYVFEAALLKLTLKRHFEIYEYRLQLSPLKKLWLSWRCKQHYKARHIRKLFIKLNQLYKK